MTDGTTAARVGDLLALGRLDDAERRVAGRVGRARVVLGGGALALLSAVVVLGTQGARAAWWRLRRTAR